LKVKFAFKVVNVNKKMFERKKFKVEEFNKLKKEISIANEAVREGVEIETLNCNKIHKIFFLTKKVK